MAGPLDDLDFSINAHVRDAMDDIKRLNAGLNEILKSVDNIDNAFRSFGQSMGLPAEQIELLQLKFQPLINSLSRAKKQAGSLEEAFTRRLMQKALEDHSKKVIRLADGTERARYQMIRLAEASQQIRPPDAAPRITGGGGGGQSGGVNFVRVTAAAGQLAILSRVSATMKSVSSTIDDVGKRSAVAFGYMDNFRLGLTAVKPNPAMNVVKNSFDALGSGASNVIDTVRGVADAILSDLPGSANAAVKAMGGVDSALESVTATASKHISKLQQLDKGLGLLSTVFPFAADAILKVRGPLETVTEKATEAANKVVGMQASVGNAAADMRAKTYVLTGLWADLSATTDVFARSQYYALLPQRLLVREIEGAQRVVKVATYAWNFLTHPIHSVTLSLSAGRAQWQDLNSRLPKLTGGLQLTARAHRLVSQSAFLVTSALRPLTREIVQQTQFAWRLTTGTIRLGGAALRPLGRIALGTASAIGRMGLSAVGTAAKITGLGVVAGGAAVAFGKLTGSANQSGVVINSRFTAVKNQYNSAMDSMINKANMMKLAAAGLAASMLIIGTKTAIATEKNNAVFGVMMKDMDQGAAVVKSIQGTQAAKLFDNQELLDSGRLLFKAGVSATNVAGKTNQLATIAAATSTELSDLSRIYQQGANSGAFGQDKINQLAERGIDIYHALEAATGKSGGELKAMISDGKIGLAEMDAALNHLTEGNGIYAGSLEAMANTTDGKLKTIKNNVSQALGQVMGVALEVLAPFGTAIVTLSESLTAAFNSFREPIIYAATAVAWFFGNMVSIGQFAWASTALFAVTAFNDIAYWFTDKLPAYLTWFSQNWKQVFWDAGNIVLTVFQNMGKNILMVMKQVWAYIKSGGTSELKFAFTPLLDGFKATVSELPNIPDRAMTELEKSLTAQTEQLGGQLANNFDTMLADAQTKVDKAPVEIKDTAGKLDAGSGDGAASANAAANKAAENKAIGVRSAEGQSLAAQLARGQMSKEDKALKVQEEQKVILERMERNQRKQGNTEGKKF